MRSSGFRSERLVSTSTNSGFPRIQAAICVEYSCQFLHVRAAQVQINHHLAETAAGKGFATSCTAHFRSG